jgi:hypothetical protein
MAKLNKPYIAQQFDIFILLLSPNCHKDVNDLCC